MFFYKIDWDPCSVYMQLPCMDLAWTHRQDAWDQCVAGALAVWVCRVVHRCVIGHITLPVCVINCIAKVLVFTTIFSYPGYRRTHKCYDFDKFFFTCRVGLFL